MAEEKQKKQEKNEDKAKKPEAPKKNPFISKEEPTGKIIRILQTDVPGNKTVYAGLTRIKGVSWAISNAVCMLSKTDKNKKIEALSKEEIAKLEDTIKNGKFPRFMINRRNDFETGEDRHVIGADLDMTREMDIKRLKKIRSYRGLRHATGQPTRGQSTRSHFRTNRKKGVGIGEKTAAKPAAAGGAKQ